MAPSAMALIDRVFGGLHGVRGAIVAIDAIHHTTLTLRDGTFQARRTESDLRSVRESALLTHGIVVRVGSVVMYSMWPR